MSMLGQYFPQESIIHSLDPRVKIMAVIALSIMILHVGKIGLCIVFFILIIVSLLAHIETGILLKTLRPVLPFFFCLFLLYIFFTPGKAIPPFPIGPVQISYAGLIMGLIQISKFILLVLAAAILTMTTTPSAISSGLEHLLRPLKRIGVSSHDITMLISLALRFLPALLDQMKQISEAQIARGASFNPVNLRGKIRAISYLTIPLLINIFRNSDQLVDAMESRGYQPGPRTYLYQLSFSRVEYCLMAAIILSLIFVLLI